MPRWIVWCVYGSFLAALPTALWRIFLAAGFTLGTPAAWRDFQDIPGGGNWYVLGLSIAQLIAATCGLALAVDIRRLTPWLPGWIPAWLRRHAAAIGGITGIVGSAVLAVLVAMSAIAWDNVDPFGGQSYDFWAWLCLGCYLVAPLWPALLGAASIGYLARKGRA